MPRSHTFLARVRPLATVAAALAGLLACDRERPLFESLDARRTGIEFANVVTTSDSFNVQTDVYVYNGAGVAVGDVNDDGLPDLFFAGNMVTSRLYLNRGAMKFEDVTERAGVGTTRWATGATMADVNGDGRLDIYVSVSGRERTPGPDRANLLFLNDGDGTFTEAAARLGIADTSFTTQSAFLDYDRDGCLDLFVLNNAPKDFTRLDVVAKPKGDLGGTPGSLNVLYRGRCDAGEPRFTDVTRAAGILDVSGFGLGVAVADLNRDGWPDIYVSNDGAPNDVLYVNDGDGTFTDRSGAWLKRASVAGMGVDVADVNDDGWPDLLQVDMMPADPARRKRIFDYSTYGGQAQQRSRGFRDDYPYNSLQLSNGLTPAGDVVFSEIAHLAGVAATDWSWAPLFADFDNDGRKDLFISNGYPKAVNDMDYRGAVMRAHQGGPARAARDAYRVLETLPGYVVPNHVFRNEDGLTFGDSTDAWGLGEPSVAYGAAWADLDNDGALDLVVSNLDAPASIYHNRGARRGEARHWLQVRLVSDPARLRGLGARLTLFAAGRRQHAYHSPTRGYMSSVDEREHFGLGAATTVDSLEVVWPDGRRQLLSGLRADTLLVVRQADARERVDSAAAPSWRAPALFEPADLRAPAHAQARDDALDDYAVQSLLPYLPSRQGPVLAVGDANGDGLDDVWVGAGTGAPSRLHLQRASGGFAPAASQPWASDSLFEDWGATFLDANGDGRQDLYVASGGYRLAPTSARLRHRLYVNQGGGRFVRDTLALPAFATSGAAVRAADFDGDGRVDLFVGGRLTPRAWPLPAPSHLLRNEGGRFVDVTARVAPELAQPGGMVTDAEWVDYDGDGRLDLVTVGEWMGIEFYHNEGGRLRRATASLRLPPLRGWWYALAAADLDGDGRVDLVAGNLGRNSTFTTGPDGRFGVYAGDLSGNGGTSLLFTRERGGVDYPQYGHAMLGSAIFPIGAKYPTAGAFATATVAQAIDSASLARALRLQADEFRSVVLHNEGGASFRVRPLPTLAQASPIRGIVSLDADGDGRLDLLVAGNRWSTEVNAPRQDAGNGLLLRGDGRGGLAAVPPIASGFLAPGDVSGLALLRTPSGPLVLVAATGDTLRAFAPRRR